MEGCDPAEEFLQEAAALLAQLEGALHDLATSPADFDLIDRAFCALHSLKGAGMMFGWEALATFIHQVETTLVRVRCGGLPVTPALVVLALGVAKYLHGLLERPEDTSPTQGIRLLAALAALTSDAPPTGAIPQNQKTIVYWEPHPQKPIALSQEVTEGNGPSSKRSIETLFQRFQMRVQELSQLLGKHVALTWSSGMLMLDKNIIDTLHTPLVHLLRNAIDHGIETPIQRLATGKSPVGRLHLAARISENVLAIMLVDDGHGLDCASIRAQAEARGWIQPGQSVEREQLFECILQPSFSTAVAITDISGRGVGMDVVKRTMDSLGGTIQLASEPGQGTTITLKVPIQLDTKP